MDEIVSGIWHWTALHEGIGVRVSSYYVASPKVVLDPKLPEGGGLDALPGEVAQVVLTSGHHLRDGERFAAALDVPIRASVPAMHHMGDEVRAVPFAEGEELAPRVQAIQIGVLCEDEGALHIAVGDGALAIADGIHRSNGELAFFSDELLGEDPEAIRAGLRDVYRGLLDLEFDTLLFAHGEPLARGGKAALREFVA